MAILLGAAACALTPGSPAESDVLPDWIRRRLEDRERVLCVAAHPDDEDSGLLLWAREHLGPADVMFVTTGEGGQNAVGPELGERLGRIRRREILRACQITGARPHFLGFLDFGFCKRPAEAFERWGGEDEVVRRMVAVLRRVRPTRVYTNHTPELGHGHHRATSLALRAAVIAAGDARRFPEQLEAGLTPWQVAALYERVDAPDARRADPDLAPPSDEVQLDYDLESAVEPGVSLAELAHQALEQHRSQGPWPAFEPGAPHGARYTRIHSTGEPAVPRADVTDRAAVPVPRTRGELVRALQEAEPDDPVTSRWRTALADAEGLRARLQSAPEILRTGGIAEARIELTGTAARTRPQVELHGAHLVQEPVREADGRWLTLRFVTGSEATREHSLEVVLQWSVPSVPFPLSRSLSFTAPVRDGGPAVELARAGWPRRRDSDRGTDVTLSWIPARETARLTVFPVAGTELLHPRDGRVLPSWTVPARARSTQPVALRLRSPGSGFEVRCVEDGLEAATAVAGAWRDVQARLPAALRVAFLAAQDGTAGAALATMGADVTVFPSPEGDADGPPFDPAAFDVVVLDVRLLGRVPAFRAVAGSLRDFVRDGGTLLALYHKSAEWNCVDEPAWNPAPYPLALTSTRVCEEAAAVQFLQPDHPLLTAPYRLTAADFDGWVQERGLYFPEASYDARYEELLGMHDTGEPLRRGALLTVRFGAGRFTYCALALHRQLRECHPGAFRLLGNLVTPDRLR